MGGNNKINQQNKCVLKQVQTALTNDKNKTLDLKLLIFIMTFLIGILTPPRWAWMVTKLSLNKISFIGIYANDLVKFLVFVWIFICKIFLKNFPVLC